MPRMAKQRKRRQQQAAGNRRTALRRGSGQARGDDVLYIAEANTLLPYDDQRKGRSSPLRFILMRCPADNTDEGHRFRMRREKIKVGPEGMSILGVYDEILVAFGGDRIAALRGWVIDQDLNTCSPALVAQVIGCRDVDLVRRSMAALMRVGLLERRPRPDFKRAMHDDRTIEVVPRPPCPQRERAAGDATPAAATPTAATTKESTKEETPYRKPTTPTTPTTATTATTEAATTREQRGEPSSQHEHEAEAEAAAKPAQRGAAGGNVGRMHDDKSFRPPPDTGGGTVYRRRQTGDRHGDGTAAESAAPPPSPFPDPGYGKTEDLKPEPDPGTAPAAAAASPQASPSPDGNAGTDTAVDAPQAPPGTRNGHQGHDPAADRATGAGHAQPTAEPSESDSGSDSAHPTETDPGGRQARPSQAGEVHVDIMVQRCMELLYPTPDDLVLQGRKHQPPQNPIEFDACERGCFASAWTAVAMCGLDQVTLLRLVQRAEKEALATRRKKLRKPRGAAWRYWLNRHMEKDIGARWTAASRAAKLGLNDIGHCGDASQTPENKGYSA